jgi:hypothetical protein
MKNVAKQGLTWLTPCVLIAVAYAPLHLQPSTTGTVPTIQASQVELTNVAGDPITDDPNVRKCICKLWQSSRYGFVHTEAGMDIVRSKGGSLSCRLWPFSNLHQRAETPAHWPLDDVAAFAHTHPRKGAVQHPTDPDDYMAALDDYVVCADGVFSARKGCTNRKDKKSCTLQPAGPKWYEEWCE